MKIEYKKLIGDYWQITTPDERWYSNKTTKEIDELKSLSQEDFYPSVTWIGSYYPKTVRYMKWLAEKGWDEAEAIKNAAGEKGSRVHKACGDLMAGNEVKMDSKYSDINGEEKELSAEEYGIVMTFHKFLQDEQPLILGIEYNILNHWNKFGGTVDLKCRLKSDSYKSIWILDIKTSANIWPSYEIQVSAYKKTDLEVQKIGIVQVGYFRNKQGYKFTEIVPQFELFLSTQQIWKKETEGTLVPQRLYPLALKWDVIKALPEEVKIADIQIPAKPKKVVKKKLVKRKK